MPALASARVRVAANNLIFNELDAWRVCLTEALGPCRISPAEVDERTFRAGLRNAQAGPLQVVQLWGEGASLRLERQQSEGFGVLWCPQVGVHQERLNGVELLVKPGQALWIAPGVELDGVVPSQSLGHSVLVPSAFLHGHPEIGTSSLLLDPWRVGSSREERQVIQQTTLLVEDLHQRPDWVNNSAGLLIESLEQLIHSRASDPRTPEEGNTSPNLAERFLTLAREQLLANPKATLALPAMAAALFSSPRNLQLQVKQHFGMPPKRVWSELKAEILR